MGGVSNGVGGWVRHIIGVRDWMGGYVGRACVCLCVSVRVRACVRACVLVHAMRLCFLQRVLVCVIWKTCISARFISKQIPF